MALKHGKYVYIRRSDGYYIKARVFKSRGDDANKYVIVGPKLSKPPANAVIVREEQLEDRVRERLHTL